MRKLKKVVCVLALTALLVAVTAVDGTLLMTGAADAQIGEAQISCAAAGPFPEIRLKKPHYDDDGHLIGCWGKGTKCVIVVMAVGGKEHEMVVAAWR
ncbi:unnamed protein product [marine sediment metagenome]|uniref:Uncharacterized protein n=1 Tax=marine sediment metagenome TaxID=412755 RepID=X1KJS2_9ZZZZ